MRVSHENTPTIAEQLGAAQLHTFQVSLFTAEQPDRLSKRFCLDKEGKLCKEGGGNLSRGTVETKAFGDIRSFAEFLPQLAPKHALAYGVCSHSHARIVCKDKLDAARRSAGRGVDPAPIIARTKEYFAFPNVPGILMLDYDPPAGTASLSPEDLLLELYALVPELKAAPHLIRGSASSHVYYGARELRGATGWRVLVLVSNTRDIPRVGQIIYRRSWLAGHGRIVISSAGSMLERGLVDASVWQPERLDFIGGAECESPLEQRIPPVKVFNADNLPLDTNALIPNLSKTDQDSYSLAVANAKNVKAPDARKTQTIWVEKCVADQLDAEGAKDEKVREARAQIVRKEYEQAILQNILFGDFKLTAEFGDVVTVNEILDNPDRWHGRRFADPLEPEYRNDKRVAYVNLRATGRPYLYSHAHGGRRFGLQRLRHEIRIVTGDRKQIVQKCLEVLRTERVLYERGGEIVSVSPTAEILPMDQDRLQLHLDGVARFEKYDKRSEKWSPTDCPASLAKGVYVSRGHWGLPNIRAVVTAPTLDPRTGRIIDQDGYDVSSEILVVCNEMDDWPGVPTNPNQDQVRDAFNVLLHPFRDFPCCDPTSWGVLIATVLASMIRACLPTAPGTLFTSPVPGSGKTLLAKCIAALAGRGRAAMLPSSSNEEEVRKRLLAFGRVGHPVMTLDNVNGELESDSLCAWLTTEEFSDRVLGLSEMVTISTQCMLLLTGNNVQLRGDLCRRVLTCAIDPAMEEPWRRRFAFDPAGYCHENKLKMVAAGLTLLRATILKGARPNDRTASFELWSDTVRSAVLMIKEMRLFDVGDPVDSFSSSFALDDEQTMLERLMLVWDEAFQDAPKTVAEVAQHALAQAADQRRELFDSLYAVAGEQSGINAKRFGKWLTKVERRERHGLRFERGKKRDGVCTWRVISTNGVGQVC